MLISVVADSLYIRLVFRAQGGAADVVRAVDITWSEAAELQERLRVVLEENPKRPAEQDSRRNLSRAQYDGE